MPVASAISDHLLRTAIRVIRSVTAFVIIGGCSGAFCQLRVEPPSPIRTQSDRYEALFRQVAELENVSGPDTLLDGKPIEPNGRLVEITRTTAQEAIGLTDQESQVLNAVASACEASIREFDISVRPLIFEARLQVLASENSPSAAHLLTYLDNERDQIVLDHIRRVKAAFGDSRFMVLDEWVHSRKQANFFPPVGAPRVQGN
jgi:hypothetical protein